MLNVTNNTASGEIGNAPSLLLGCHRARYAELLSPTEVAEMAADAGLEAAPQGWVIHAELSSEDIEHLTQQPKPPARLVVQDFDGGLPVVILTTQVNGLRCQWAVPMWEKDAQLWLRDSVERGHITLMLNAFDASVSVVMMTACDMLRNDEALLRVASVQKQLTGNENLFHMLNAGLYLMNDTSGKFARAQEPPLDNRVMVAGRGANAVLLMNTFFAATQAAQALSTGADEVIQ